MSTKKFTFEGDGYKFEVELSIDDDGNVTAKVTAVEGSADFNAFYWGDDDGEADFGGFKGRDSSLNMNGEGSQYDGEPVFWDGAQKISNPGLGREGQDKFSFIKEGESQTFNLTHMSADDFENLEFFGIRATSVNGDDSLKLVGKPEDDNGNGDDLTDHFPDLDRDISYVNFVFKLDDDADPAAKALDKNGDGYVTVKVNIPNLGELEDCLQDNVNNLDTWYQEALAAIYADPKFAVLEENSELVGAFIKGGQNLFGDSDLFDQNNVWSTGAENDIAFFSLDNDPGNDPLPEGLRTDSDGNIVATGPSRPDRDRYDDTGNDLAFDFDWVPEECLA